MSEWIDRLDREIRDTATARIRFEYGITTAAPSGSWVATDILGDSYPVKIPAHFATTVTAGLDVRISVHGTVRVLDAILTPLPSTPLPPTPLSAAPSAAASSTHTWTVTPAGPAGFLEAGFSNSGFTAQDYQNAYYAEYLAGFGRAGASDTTGLRNAHNALVTYLNTVVIPRLNQLATHDDQKIALFQDEGSAS